MRLHRIKNGCLSIFLMVPTLVGCGQRAERSPGTQIDRGEPHASQLPSKIFNSEPYAVISDSIGRGMLVRSDFGQIMDKGKTSALMKLSPDGGKHRRIRDVT